MAQTVIKDATGFDQRLDLISLRLLNRKMATDERATVKTTFESAKAYYEEKPEQARRAIEIGEMPVDETLSETELAAWSIIANQIFNLDETVTR